MDKGSISERVREIASKVVAANEFELVLVETAGTKRDLVVRVYIDKDGGITLDDCSTVSRGIEEVLDTEDFIPAKYVLEVSSPGIERELYSLADFVRFTGKLAKVKTKFEIEGQTSFVGVIESVSGEEITLRDRVKGSAIRFDYPVVAKANLKIDLSKEFGHG